MDSQVNSATNIPGSQSDLETPESSISSQVHNDVVIVQSDGMQSDGMQSDVTPLENRSTQVSNILPRSEFQNSRENYLTPPPRITITINSETEMVPHVRGTRPEVPETPPPQLTQPSVSIASEIPEIIGPLRFETIPDKILVRILRMIPREDLDEIKSVSSQFRILIDGQIGLSVSIGSVNENLMVDGSIGKLKEIGVSSCTVLNLINTKVPERPYKHPNLLRSLTINGYISERNFIRLVSTTSNVEKLVIDLSTMTTVEFQDIDIGEIFPKLAQLRITCGRDFFFECSNVQWLTCIYSLIGLLDKKYPNLREFNIGIPYVSKFENMVYNVSSVLTKYILRHGISLKRLAVDYNGLYEDVEFDEIPNPNDDIFTQPITLDTLEEISLSLVVEDEGDGPPRDPASFVAKVQQQWAPLLKSQRKLQKCLITHSIFLSPDIAENVCQNNKLTLKVLHWKFQKQDREGVRVITDLSIFQDCVNLEEIVLSGPTEEDFPFVGNDQAWWTRPRFSNLMNLPKNLKKIKLDCCDMASLEFPILPTAFPQLKYLSLDTGCHEPNGMSVETLAALLDKDSLKLLILLKSFNSKSQATAANPGTNSTVVSIIRALLNAWRISTPLSAMSTLILRRNVHGAWENAGHTFGNNHRDMFPTPMASRHSRVAVVPPLPPPHRNVHFDLE